jgi:TatA/E family protein of Tat protein translocase
MFGLHPFEIFVIAVAALLIFGPKALPKLGKTVGRTLREFRDASNEIKDEFQKGYRKDEEGERKGGKKP